MDDLPAIPLPNENSTRALGQAFSTIAAPKDVFLLSGDIGAGKTCFARAFIQSLTAPDQEVPSPTFTLVQTYQSQFEIWHCDLYRLSDPNEAVELGLTDAFDTAICLIEWPDRLGSLTPKNALEMHFVAADDMHSVTFCKNSQWMDRLKKGQILG